MAPKKVLFVCLGNICRSPIAEAVFLHLVKEKKREGEWEADSAATGSWHTGSLPDERALSTLAKHNVPYNNRARQIRAEDFVEFDYIFGMDPNNMKALNDEASRVSNARAKVMLLGDFDPQGEKVIRDPYYDNHSKGFEKCFDQCLRCCEAFLEEN